MGQWFSCVLDSCWTAYLQSSDTDHPLTGNGRFAHIFFQCHDLIIASKVMVLKHQRMKLIGWLVWVKDRHLLLSSLPHSYLQLEKW